MPAERTAPQASRIQPHIATNGRHRVLPITPLMNAHQRSERGSPTRPPCYVWCGRLPHGVEETHRVTLRHAHPLDRGKPFKRLGDRARRRYQPITRGSRHQERITPTRQVVHPERHAHQRPRFFPGRPLPFGVELDTGSTIGQQPPPHQSRHKRSREEHPQMTATPRPL